MSDRLTDAARVIAEARRSRSPLGQLDPSVRPGSVGEAYLVQDRVHDLLHDRHGDRIGYKIGCTTRVMQEFLGIPSPCHAGVFAGSTRPSGAVLDPAKFRRIGIECEIGVRLGRRIETTQLDDPRDALAAVETVFAAIEVVDDRYANWRQTDTPTLVADDFFAAGCVHGAEIPIGDVTDLADLAGATRINGVEVGRGTGRDVLGHPGNALIWLARSLAELGRRLEPGEIVLTGSLVETKWLEAGDRAEIEIDGLGVSALTVAA